jgi:predicted nucleic acid-binding protein
MRYMWDTNSCIYLIKNRSDTLLNRMRTFRTAEIGVSVVTVAELKIWRFEKSTEGAKSGGTRGVPVAS